MDTHADCDVHGSANRPGVGDVDGAHRGVRVGALFKRAGKGVVTVVGDGPEEHVQRGGSLQVAVGKQVVEAMVGTGQGGEALFVVVSTADRAVEEASRDFQKQFIGEREQRHRGSLNSRMFGVFWGGKKISSSSSWLIPRPKIMMRCGTFTHPGSGAETLAVAQVCRSLPHPCFIQRIDKPPLLHGITDDSETTGDEGRDVSCGGSKVERESGTCRTLNKQHDKICCCN